MTQWPNAQDYNIALQNPAMNFGDPRIKQAKAETTPLGMPRARTGAFATVYRMEAPTGDFAIRCFLKPFNDHRERYEAISKRLRSASLPFTVGFDFIEEGVRINGQWYPILRMDWVTGQPINRYVEKNLHDPQKLLGLADQVVDMIHRLRDQQIAHCDLQNGNILVSNERLVLIDYDGMYVPELHGRGSHEQGHRNFQHPLRTDRDYGPTIDNFSGWVIYTSLLALSIDPNLWTLAGAAGNDEQLLFTREDFSKPSASPTLRHLTKHPNPSVQALATFFQSILFFDVDQVPPLDQHATNVLTTVSTPTLMATRPSWLQKQLSTASASFQTSPPTDQPGLSSWIFDGIAASQALPVKAFSANRSVPRITMALSSLSAAIAVLLVATNPAITLIVSSAMIFIAAMNILVLIVSYDNDPAVKEARDVLAEQKKCTQLLNAIKKEIQLSDNKKADIRKQYMKEIDDLKQQRDKLKSNEQAEIASEGKRLTKLLTAISDARNKLAQSETNEQNALLNSQDGSRIRQINTSLQNLQGSENNELSAALADLQRQHLDSYLQRQYISSANISGIGEKLKARLSARGFRTAADIRGWSVQSVEGIGQAKANALEAWLRGCEASARATMPSSVPQSVINGIKSKYAAQRSTLEQELKTLQPRLDAGQKAIRDKYQLERTKLAQEQNTAQQAKEAAVKAIQQRYAQEFPIVDQQIANTTDVMTKELALIDENIKTIQKQMFAANLNLAKAQRKLTPYKRLTFRRYVKAVITNNAA